MSRILGIDVGIASIGFALVDFDQQKIIICGSHLFDKAENPKDGSSLAAPRRIARSQRRRLRRRRQRRQSIIELFKKNGLEDISSIHSKLREITPDKTPWQLRAEGLNRRLEPEEFARALLHIAKRRGFQSTRKTQVEKDNDGKVMLEAAQELRRNMSAGGFETIGEYLASLDKKKNLPGSYNHTVLRDLLRDEVAVLFEKQRNFDNPLATENLRQEYADVAFYQRPLQPSINLVGYCQFEETEKRAPKAARSAELFVAYSTLANLRILDRRMNTKPITHEERDLLLKEAHKLKGGLTFAKARTLLKLGDEEIFNLAKYLRDKPGQGTWEEVRKKAEKAPLIQFKSWIGLATALDGLDGQEWDKIKNNTPLLDQLAVILTFYEEESDIRSRLQELDLSEQCINALVPIHFKQTINLSLKALNNILPYMAQGDRYDEACVKAGYHHSQKGNKGQTLLPPFEPTRNPVVDRSLSQSRKVINALIREYGMPDYFHIEMGRELGKSIKARRETEREQEKFRKHKQEMAEQAHEVFNREPSGTELLKYRLWKEQQGYCLYSGEYIEPQMLRDPNATQIDHALPYSKSWDNSHSNKVLCLTKENQNKKDQTPYEYLKEERWESFVARVGSLPVAKRKKLLVQDFDEETADAWKDRNLTDTRYVARVLKNHIQQNLRPNPGIKLLAQTRNGFITNLLRDRWGLGRKVRDESARHHALDAVILACTTTSMVKQVADWSRSDRQKQIKDMPKPWPSFREDALAEVNKVFVTRQPVRKASGAAHEDTIKSQRIDVNTGEQRIVQKVKLQDLTPAMLDRLVDIELVDGEPVGRNKNLYRILKQRLDEYGGNKTKAFEQPIYMPVNKPGQIGPVIRGVNIRTGDKTGIPIPGRNGIAQNESMIRVDIFQRNGQYFLIPIYVNHLAVGVLPDKVCKAHKSEEEWPKLDESYNFLFSLWKNDYVEVIKNSKEERKGYFISADRDTGGIIIRPHDATDDKKDRKVGIKSLRKFVKFTINYLGEKIEVRQEKRLGLENRATAKSHEGES